MAQPELWVVRHGETEWSRSGRHTGRTDVPLTDAGREHARRVRSLLDGQDFVMVLTSPLQRARETCRLAGYGDVAVADDDLREWDYGDYDGVTTPDIQAQRPGWSLWRDGCPAGESVHDVESRVDRVIARARNTQGTVLAFAHGHLLRVLAARWVGLPGTDGALLALDTATLSVLGWERDTAVVRRWNLSP